MSYTDRKITQEEINAHHVQGATDYLIGNAQQNKAVFDDLPEFIAGKHNELIDELNSQHGDEIKAAVDEWLAEHPEVTTTVQDNSLTTAKYVDGSVTEPKIADGAVTPSKLDRAYSTTDDLASVNANLANELNVLDARMDEFASLPEGSTSGDAELLDIRVGADGTIYPTAGDAVRGQVVVINNDLNSIDDTLGFGDAIIVKRWKRGIINQNTGEFNNSTTRIITEKFKIPSYAKEFVLAVTSGYKCAWYAYDANNNFVDYYFWLSDETNTVKIKDNWEYIVIALSNTSNTAIVTSESSNITIKVTTTLREIKKQVEESITYHNWFDPQIGYVLRDSTDSADRNGITINNDSSLSCTRYYNDYGQVMVKSADASKKLLPGTYVLSARVTINDNITVTDREIGLRVGFSNAIQFVKMKTERGGNVDTAEKVGWVSATFEITEEEVFAFCIIPRKGIASATYPIIFDMVMISNSEMLLPYSNKTEEAYDLTARRMIKTLGEMPSNALTPTDIFNGEPYDGTYDWQTPVVNYGALFKGVENVESFAFFTDPHVMGFDGRNEPNMHEYIKKVSKVFRSVPCAFTVCGGDWLNNDTIADEACYRLGYIKALADNMLCGCKLVVGNHDTNYQGKADADSERGTGRLTNETVAALMFHDTETRKAYYSFDGIRSKCYVLDTGIEHSSMLEYDWEQVGWLAEKLAQDDPEHAIIFLHIILNSGNIQTNTSNFASIVEAYNAHTTITLNGVAYDFSSCAGHVALWVGGHTHVDSTGTLGGIPYIVTSTLSYSSDVPLIDLVLVDYDNNVVKTIRVGGTGDNRTINLS